MWNLHHVDTMLQLNTMQHSPKFVSFNCTKYHFTRKLSIFDTNGGSSPYRVAKVHEVDTILQESAMQQQNEAVYLPAVLHKLSKI